MRLGARGWFLAAVAASSWLAYRERDQLRRRLTYQRVRWRLRWLQQRDRDLQEIATTAQDLAWVAQGKDARGLLERAFLRYSARPCLGLREPSQDYRTVSYGELHARLGKAAAGLAAQAGVKAGGVVGICGTAGLDWVVADLACLRLRAVSVPFSHLSRPDEIAHVVEQAGVECCFCSASEYQRLRPVFAEAPQLKRVVLFDTRDTRPPRQESGLTVLALPWLESLDEPVPPLCDAGRESDLYSIVYTSGSTGASRGVMLPLGRWSETLRDGLARPPMPRVTLGYLPFCHMAGRINLYLQMMAGGTTYLLSEPDLSSLFDDLARVRPTHLVLVPRVSQMIYDRFQEDYVARGGRPHVSVEQKLRTPVGRALIREMREGLMGGRWCFAHTGSAPTAPEILRFLEAGFRIHLNEVYGSTEMGPVTVNGRVHPYLQYKLIDRPELGYTRQDKPYPRGELAIKSPRLTPGYFGNEQASAALRDHEGYLLSGDIVEERKPGHIVWLDRTKTVLRLSHGKFVNVPRLEQLFPANSPIIQQIFLWGEPTRSYLLAVVVCPEGTTRAQVREELNRIASLKALRAHEIPRDYLLESEPFNQRNGLLGAANKFRRNALRDRYGQALQDLVQQIEERRHHGLEKESHLSGADLLRHEVARTLGVPSTEVDLEASFAALGGDSLSAVRLRDALAPLGVSVPVGRLLDPTTSMSVLLGQDADEFGNLRRLTEQNRIRAAQVQLSDHLDLSPPSTDQTGKPGVRLLLTGATGLLGRALVLELLERLPAEGELVCLVRTSDSGSAARRLESAFRDTAALERLRQLQERGRLTVLKGDLTQKSLGLSEAVYADLADNTDIVIHSAALVNHALPLDALVGPNVEGVLRVLQLAGQGRTKQVHFLSTAGLLAGSGHLSEAAGAALVWPERRPDDGGYAAGYVTSKWLGELLVEQWQQRTGARVGVYRPSMLLPHSKFPGECNPQDSFCRLISSLLLCRVAPTTFYRGPRKARFYDGLPVDQVAGFLAERALGPGRGLERFHPCVVDPEKAPSLDDLVDWMEEVVSLQRLPYARFVQRLRERMESLPQPARRYSLLPLLSHWEQPLHSRHLLRPQTERFWTEYRQSPSGVPGVSKESTIDFVTRLAESFKESGS